MRKQALAGTLRCAATVVAAGVLLVSCSKEESDSPAPLSARELRFSVSQQDYDRGGQPVTKAAPVETGSFHSSFGVLGYAYPSSPGWNGGNDKTPNYMYNVKYIRTNSTGSAGTTDDPYLSEDGTWFLPGSGTNISFFAYAPYGASGLALPDKETAGVPEFKYTVPGNVDEQSDLCFTGQHEVAGGAEDGTVQLRFSHALTAVSFAVGSNMRQDITIHSISLTGIQNTATYKAGDSGNGGWSGHSGNATYTFQSLKFSTSGKSDGDAITSGGKTLMLLPQTLPADAKLTVTFTPDGENQRTISSSISGEWRKGRHVCYKLGILGDKLEIEGVNGGTWSIGCEDEITSTAWAEYTADRLKIGDYFYSDGTTSDGGLRRIDRLSDGTLIFTVDQKSPTDEKTVIGIVYATWQDHKERFGEVEKEKLKELGITEPHGLVMSTTYINELDMRWASSNTDIPNLTNCTTREQCLADISGLGNTQEVDKVEGEHQENCVFAKIKEKFANAPETTTGWYLPSIGQLWDIVHNLSGLSESSLTSGELWESNVKDPDFSVCGKLNEWMSAVNKDSKNEFESTSGGSDNAIYYYSSSEYDTNNFRCFNINVKIYCSIWNKSNQHERFRARPVLAF